jgi:hypothetical protein
MSDHDQQWLTLALAVLVTAAILTLDALLWSALGAEATFSRAFGRQFHRWPVCAAVALVWVGILVGHLLPARP